MNTTDNDSREPVSPGDPRLTAYAFGELDGDELVRIEAAVQADPQLQAAVAELRAFSGELATALADETTGDAIAPVAVPRKRRGVVIPFPFHYLAAVAAACFAVVVWVRNDGGAPEVKPAPAMTQERVEAKAVRGPQQELDHRLRVARKAPEEPIFSPVSPALVSSTAESDAQVLAAPAMPELPSVGASSFASAGFGQGIGAVGAGTGYSTGLGVAGGYADADGSTHMSFMADRSRVNRSKAAPVALNESYGRHADNVYRMVEADPLSTFSVDVDTASYSNIRRFLTGGHLPVRDAVRVEELINYFPYRYTPPKIVNGKEAVPFAAKLEVTSAPWAPAHRLVRIGLKGREFTAATRPPASLVFLLDVSGSMDQPNKLPLLKESLRLLIERLRADDRVAIVTYAGGSGLALPSTPASKKHEILAALDGLRATGSTNGAIGIHLAYDIAKANFSTNGLNRVILCTDGDFNVGVTDRDALVRLIEEKARSRVFLSVFGFGMGNLKDNTLESLADKGNGAYGYIDTRREAEKIFVEQVEGTLVTIAKDVKVQVEFNPALVASYRLIGYENRLLKKEDFNDDAIDAGDIGAGHTVTALYEVVLVGVGEAGSTRPLVDTLKYQKMSVAGARKLEPLDSAAGELLTVKIRYKAPEGEVSRKQEFPLVDTGAAFEQADAEFQFAAAVAAWGMLLRDSPHKGSATFEQVIGWAEQGLGDDAGGYRSEFVELVRKSAELSK